MTTKQVNKSLLLTTAIKRIIRFINKICSKYRTHKFHYGVRVPFVRLIIIIDLRKYIRQSKMNSSFYRKYSNCVKFKMNL